MTNETELETYLTVHAEEIVRLLEGIPKEQGVNVFEKGFKRERFGNPYSKFLKGTFSFRKGGEDSVQTAHPTQFYVQHFNGDSENGAAEQEPLFLKYLLYQLFQESGITPIPHELPSIQGGILLSSRGDQMLEERLAGLPLDERFRLAQVATDVLLNFHMYAGSILAKVVSKAGVIEAIREREARPFIEKAVSNFRTIYQRKHGKLPSDAAELEFAELFSPFSETLDEYKGYLIHGDSGAQNFVGYKNKELWTPENVSVIDLTKMRLGHFMSDVANLLTSNNMLLSSKQWIKIVDDCMAKQASRPFQLERKWILGTKKIELPPFDPEYSKEGYSLYFTSAVCSPLKNRGYVGRLGIKSPQKLDVWASVRPSLGYTEEGMGREMKQALEYIPQDSGRFFWNDTQLMRIKGLSKFLIGEGLLPERDITKDLEERNKKAYEELRAKN